MLNWSLGLWWIMGEIVRKGVTLQEGQIMTRQNRSQLGTGLPYAAVRTLDNKLSQKTLNLVSVINRTEEGMQQSNVLPCFFFFFLKSNIFLQGLGWETLIRGETSSLIRDKGKKEHKGGMVVRGLERASSEKSSLISLVQVLSHPSFLLLQCFLLTATTAHARVT